jgi:hypothetical protein
MCCNCFTHELLVRAANGETPNRFQYIAYVKQQRAPIIRIIHFIDSSYMKTFTPTDHDRRYRCETFKTERVAGFIAVDSANGKVAPAPFMRRSIPSLPTKRPQFATPHQSYDAYRAMSQQFSPI